MEYVYETTEGKFPKIFVETGTAMGMFAIWASHVFDRVVTVEFYESIYHSAVERFWKEGARNILPIYGDSAKVVPMLRYLITEPAIWWLDAHSVDDQAL